MNKSIVTFLIASTFMIPLAVEARRDQRRERHQEARIAEGVKSGELTKAEARKLHRGQKRVDAAQNKAMADGNMSPEEKAKIEKMQDRQSQAIYNQKHDEQKREEPAVPANPDKE